MISGTTPPTTPIHNQVVTSQPSKVPLENQGQIEFTADDSSCISFTTGIISGIGRKRGRTRRSHRGGGGIRGERTCTRGYRAGSQTDCGDYIG